MWGGARYQEHVLRGFCYVPYNCDTSENPGPLCGKSRPQLLSGLPEFFLLWHSRKSRVCLATAFFFLRHFLFFFLPDIMIAFLLLVKPDGCALLLRVTAVGVKYRVMNKGLKSKCTWSLLLRAGA